MPSEFYTGPFDSREPTPCNHPPQADQALGQQGLYLPNSAQSALKSSATSLPATVVPEVNVLRTDNSVFGTPTSQSYGHTYTPSSMNSIGLGLERQAARDDIGMVPVIRSQLNQGKERVGIIGLLAMGQEKVLHFVTGGGAKENRASQDPSGGIIETVECSARDFGDAQSLASQDQHVVFSDPPPQDKSVQVIDTNVTPTGESSESSSSGGFSIHSRMTPYPSPIVLGELIIQQANEEADGSLDDDPNSNSREKEVRLVRGSRPIHSSHPPSSSPSSSSISSSASLRTVGSRTSKHTIPLSRHPRKHGNKLGKAIKRILFKKPKISHSKRSRQRRSLSNSSQTSVDTGVITPTLPQGGVREISVSKKLPSLMIKGLDRDFLPTEATLVPTPFHTPILGNPMSFDEALSTLPATTDPTPTSSEGENFGVVPGQTASPEVILTRPLLTQNMNEISPFFKMGEKFPAPPTPPLSKGAHISNTKGVVETFKLPKLDTHGLLQADSPNDTFGHQQKKPIRRMSTTTASVFAFFAKPFAKRDRRDLVASVSNEKDKDSARVGLKDRYMRDARRRNNLDTGYPVLANRNVSRSMSVTPASDFTRRASLPVVEERKPFYEFSSSFEEKSIAEAMEKVHKEDVTARRVKVAEGGADSGVEDKSKKLDAAAIIDAALGGRSKFTPTVPIAPQESFFPPLGMSPSPPSPILRPASTIPTTVRHERRKGHNAPPLNGYPVGAGEKPVVVPLPLLPLKGDRDDAAYHSRSDPGTTPPPSAATEYSASSTGADSDYSEEFLNRRRDRVGSNLFKSETGTLGEEEEEAEECEGGRRPPMPSKATSEEIRLQGRSRGGSAASERSWETGRTTLNTGETGRTTFNTSETGRATLGTGETPERVGSLGNNGASGLGDSVGGKRDGIQGRGSIGKRVEEMIGVEIHRWELTGGTLGTEDEGVD